jgi:catechol 2,3-dioxygenase-like lactoylglutathione lyase family enzyme
MRVQSQVGNLRDSLQFFGSVLGMRALRNEEFSSGCDATCNGP